ncbi:MAG: hypothetical protein K0S71_801 [Clostridia bacterium]|jgi:signal transduction histidine kinase|nr:hypothetical protein [Clostridia bacterium]
MGYRLSSCKGGIELPLKKKFALILILAVVINLLGVLLYLKIFMTTDISNDLPHIWTEFSAAFGDLGPDTTLREFRGIFIQKLQDKDFMKAILGKAVFNTIRITLTFLPILLTVVLYFIDKDILKPLNKLNKAIDDFNRRNGYYSTKHSKNEILKLTNNFYIMSEQIELNKRRKNEFISCISHDLKTPLTSILGYTQRLINPGIANEEKRLKYYDTILNKANDIKNMVEELNTYVMGEIQEVSLQQVNLKKFLNEIIEEYREELMTYSIHLMPCINLDEEICALLDDSQIRRVFANLFSNTVIHGGKDIEIILDAFVKGSHLFIRLENNGEAHLNIDYDKVFDLMYQADAARTNQNHGGRGLGLAIVKQIIEKHNGGVRAYQPSAGGFGMEFYIPVISL